MATLVSAPLPDLDLASQTTITVDAQDASAIVTQLVIHFSQDTPKAVREIDLVPPPLTFKKSGTEAPGLTR